MDHDEASDSGEPVPFPGTRCIDNAAARGLACSNKDGLDPTRQQGNSKRALSDGPASGSEGGAATSRETRAEVTPPTVGILSKSSVAV